MGWGAWESSIRTSSSVLASDDASKDRLGGREGSSGHRPRERTTNNDTSSSAVSSAVSSAQLLLNRPPMLVGTDIRARSRRRRRQSSTSPQSRSATGGCALRGISHDEARARGFASSDDGRRTSECGRPSGVKSEADAAVAAMNVGSGEWSRATAGGTERSPKRCYHQKVDYGLDRYR